MLKCVSSIVVHSFVLSAVVEVRQEFLPSGSLGFAFFLGGFLLLLYYFILSLFLLLFSAHKLFY